MSNFTAHKSIRQRLSGFVTDGRIGHAYIFEGPEGVGKTTAALWFAKISVCTKMPGIGCGKCDNCLKISSGTHPDINIVDEVFIKNPKIKPGSVECARLVKENVYKKPFMADRSFFIFPDGDALTPQAQNALLKVFEEPPEYCTIIILCSSASSLLETIRSRAVTIRFFPLSDEEITEYVKDRYGNIPRTGITTLMQGLPGMADTIFNSPEFTEEYEKITSAFERFINSNGDMTEIFPLFSKENIGQSLQSLEGWTMDKMKNLKGDDTTLSYVKIFEILQNSQLRMKKNTNFNLTVTDMLIKSWEATHG